MMSSSHSDVSITDCHSKPTVIMDYNKHKGGVDTLYENCEEFNCLRKTNRWPMVFNYNLRNVATNNAFIVMRGVGKSSKKTEFLKRLSFQLAQPQVRKRKLIGQTRVRVGVTIKPILSANLLAERMGFIDAAPHSSQRTSQPVKRGRCSRCSKHTRSACQTCKQFICPRHRKLLKKVHCLDC